MLRMTSSSFYNDEKITKDFLSSKLSFSNVSLEVKKVNIFTFDLSTLDVVQFKKHYMNFLFHSCPTFLTYFLRKGVLTHSIYACVFLVLFLIELTNVITSEIQSGKRMRKLDVEI